MAMHSLALELGMTVDDLAGRMSLGEWLDWLVFYKQRNEPPPAEEVDWSNLTPEEIAGKFGA